MVTSTQDKAIEAMCAAMWGAHWREDPALNPETCMATMHHVAAAYEAAMWRPIEEAPKDGTVVLVWNGRSVQRAYWDKIESAWVLLFRTTTRRKPAYASPTHFRPLPKPEDI